MPKNWKRWALPSIQCTTRAEWAVDIHESCSNVLSGRVSLCTRQTGADTRVSMGGALRCKHRGTEPCTPLVFFSHCLSFFSLGNTRAVAKEGLRSYSS
jgi:hypothetical protein